MKRICMLSFAGMAALSWVAGAIQAQTPSPSPGQAAIEAAAQNKRYAFVVFHKQDDAATQAVRQTLTTALAKRPNQAEVISVSVADPREKPLIDRWGLSRSPLPMVLAIAPNGAITGGFPLKLTEAEVMATFVSTGTASSLKAIQDKKVVLLVVRPAGGAGDIPAGVRAFQADPLNTPTTEIITVRGDDTAEATLLASLKVQPATTPVTVLVVPPGSSLGTFDVNVTKEQIAAKIKAAQQGCCPGGKCGADGSCSGGKCEPKQ